MLKLFGGMVILTVVALTVMGAFNIGVTRGKEMGTQAAQVALDEAQAEIDRLNAELEAVPSQPASGGADAIREYYRGVYDVCVWVVVQQGGTGDTVAQYCNQVVAGFAQERWHEQTSEGYEFPPTITHLDGG